MQKENKFGRNIRRPCWKKIYKTREIFYSWCEIAPREPRG